MPGMIRPRGKSKKIAFKLLGKPANMIDDKAKKDSKKNARLLYDETIFVR